MTGPGAVALAALGAPGAAGMVGAGGVAEAVGAPAAVGGTGTPLALYLGMGMVAAVNPCGFALLPAYLSYFLGVEGGDRGGSARAGFGQALRVALSVSAGFLAVFAVAGIVVEAADPEVVYDNMPWLSLVIGAALVALGVAMLFGFEAAARLPRLDRGGGRRTIGSMALFGVSYAVASVGCTLPMFVVAVSGTMQRESLADGVVVFGAYGLGMVVVLTALTVAISLARTSLVRLLRRAQQYVSRVSGALVALAGAYVVHYGWEELRAYRDDSAPDSGVIDTVTGWSYDLQGWIDSVGPVRILVVVACALAALAIGFRLRDGSPDAGQGARRSRRQPVGAEGPRR